MVEIASSELAGRLGLEHKTRIGADSAAPLVYLVHGRAGNYDVMWTFARCIPEGFNVISPQAFVADPLGGFSWWPIEGKYDRQTVDAAVRRLDGFVRSAEESYGLRPSRRLALGFSQGAGLLSCFVQERPELFAKVGLLAGFVIDCGGLPAASGLPRIFMAHGIQDAIIPPAKAEAGAALLRSYGFEVEFHTDDVGHKVGSSGMRALKEWLAAP